MMKVKLEGFRELEEALSRLPKATGRGVLRRIAKGALKPIADQASSGAPRRSGKLAVGIAVSEKRTRRASKQVPKMKASEGVQMFMGPTSGSLAYAAFTEFGTVDTPAQPFMRPAWDGGATGALDYVKENLKAEIDKATAKVAAKAAKKAAAGG